MKRLLIKQLGKGEWLIVILLACMISFGLIISLTPNNMTVFAQCKDHASSCVILFASAVVVSYVLLVSVFNWMDSIHEKYDNTEINNTFKIVSIKKWICNSAIIFACWIPYLIICYPTITRGYDYFWQLMQGMGVFPLSNHHPVLGSYVFGALFSIGYTIGGAEMGLFFTSLIQMIVQVAVISFCLSSLMVVTIIPKKIINVALGFICLCPIFPCHAIWLNKDSLFTSITVLVFYQLFLFCWTKRNNVRSPFIASAPAIACSCILFSLYRNGVIPIAILILIIMLFCIIHLNNTK